MTVKICQPARWLPIALLLLVATAAAAQQKLLTLDDIYDPDKRVNFSGNPPAGLEWIDGSHYASTRKRRPAAASTG